MNKIRPIFTAKGVFTWSKGDRLSALYLVEDEQKLPVKPFYNRRPILNVYGTMSSTSLSLNHDIRLLGAWNNMFAFNISL